MFSLLDKRLTNLFANMLTLSILDDDNPRVTTLSVHAKGQPLLHVPSSSNSGTCSLLPEDFGDLRDIRKLCLIGYSIGKTPDYIVIAKFMASV